MTNTAMRPLVRRSTIALSILTIVAVPALSGCFSGRAATTTMQATMNTGDGSQTQVGTIKIINATLVTGDPASDAMLIGSIVNVGNSPDSVLGITVAGKPVTPVPAFGELAAGSSVPFGYTDAQIKIPVSGLTAAPSSYVPVTFSFKDAGIATLQVLTVPAVGIYAGIVPLTASPTPEATIVEESQTEVTITEE